MENFFETLLWPIIVSLHWLYLNLEVITGSAGLSIVLLSSGVSMIMLPLQKWGRKVEDRIRLQTEAVNTEVAELKKTMKGEKLFFATEKIYKKHGYHPIYSVALGTSFLVVLPVLLAALMLFTNTNVLEGKSFLLISDLSKPDGLLGSVNLLPVLMSTITIIDANIRFDEDKSARRRFYVLAIVFFVLVYTLPSGLVIYWTMSNVIALLLSATSSKSGCDGCGFNPRKPRSSRSTKSRRG